MCNVEMRKMDRKEKLVEKFYSVKWFLKFKSDKIRMKLVNKLIPTDECSTYKWAKNELERIEKQCLEDGEDHIECHVMQTVVTKDILLLVKILCTQGHSGMSIQYYKHMLDRIIDRTPLTPLTGEDSEWNVVYRDKKTGKVEEQNIRCSKVFRDNGDNSTACRYDGKLFREKGDNSYFTCRESRVPVTFPCSDFKRRKYVLMKSDEEMPIHEQIKKGLFKEEF